jgi:hypothetical protein
MRSRSNLVQEYYAAVGTVELAGPIYREPIPR